MSLLLIAEQNYETSLEIVDIYRNFRICSDCFQVATLRLDQPAIKEIKTTFADKFQGFSFSSLIKVVD